MPLALAFSPPDQRSRVAALRTLLAEKFAPAKTSPGALIASEFSALDDAEGGLRRGALTELTGPRSSGALFVEVVLGILRRQKFFGALVDTGGSFDPQGANPSSLRRLLWVQCRDAQQAVKAADFLLRDGNLPLILVDFQGIPDRELRRIPASTWHRFHRLLERSATALVVLSPTPMVEGARVRIVMRHRWGLEAMRQRRRVLLNRLHAQIIVRGTQPELPVLERLSA